MPNVEATKVIERLPSQEALISKRNRMVRHSKKLELKSLILAQIERWRHALDMQVER